MELNPPYVLDGEDHPGPVLRSTMSALITNPNGGIVHPDHLAVTALGSPAMKVNVAAGTIWIPGSLIPEEQYLYGCTNDATKELDVPPADPTNARWDLVVARVYDANFSGSDAEWALEVIAGTPAGSPAFPPVPDNSRVLAGLTVPAADDTISSGQIADLRISDALGTAGAHGRIICTSTTRPTSPYVGMQIYETDTKKDLDYQGVTLGWTAPWNTAWGEVAAAERTSDYGGWGVGPSTISSLTVTHTLVSGRKYELSTSLRGYGSAAANLTVQLYDSTNAVVLQESAFAVTGSGTDANWSLVKRNITGSGSRSFVIRVIAASGNGTIVGGSTRPITLILKDVGPT